MEAVANEIGSYGQKIESTTTKSGPKERENCRCSDIGNAQLLQHRTKNQLTRKNGNSKKNSRQTIRMHFRFGWEHLFASKRALSGGFASF